MLNAFSREIRSIRAQENIGVHSGGSLARRTFSLKSDPYLYAPIVAVRLRTNLEAHSWTNERPVMARTCRPSMSALRPLPGAKRTLRGHRRMTASDPTA